MILKNGKRIDGCSDTLPVGTIQPFLGLTPPLGYLVCQGQLISKVEYPELYNICKSTFGAETETHFYLPDLRGKTIAGYDSGDSTMNTIGKLIGQKTHTHTSAAHTHTIAGHTHTSAAHVHSTGNHTLTIAEMPSHTHTLYQWTSWGSKTAVAGYYTPTSPSGGALCVPQDVVTDGNNPYYMENEYTGGSGAHNHGNTGSTTPGATGSTSLTTNSTTPGATGSNTNFQPTVVMNWIVKAAMLIPEYFIVENTLTSTSTSNALSAAQGKILNDKFGNYLPVNGTAKFAEALPGFDYFENNEQAWGNQTGQCLYRADSPSGGSIALRDNNPNNGQLSMIIDGFFYQQEGNWRCLDVSDLGNYAFYKFPVFALTSSTPTKSHSLNITAKGRPIFIGVTGDLDADNSSGSWARITIKRGSTILATEIVQGTTDSHNVPFAINYLDIVGAGSYTYSVHFEQGGNNSTFGEENSYQTPNFVIYEI